MTEKRIKSFVILEQPISSLGTASGSLDYCFVALASLTFTSSCVHIHLRAHVPDESLAVYPWCRYGARVLFFTGAVTVLEAVLLLQLAASHDATWLM